MRSSSCLRATLIALSCALLADALPAQAPTPSAAMQWRQIGPNRAGRGRAAVGVPSQPNVAYVGFDNGGVWRSTDYGNNWEPIFDHEATGSIGAIAVSPSNPNVIYVGTGAGIIRPDLATGLGVYKSTDAGKTWQHLGLFDSQMIAYIDVDPRNPDRFFVAVLGHPYGPNAERGLFRSTDGGKTFEKVLYKDEYTSANDVRIDPSDPNVVYATLWQQQQTFYEGQTFGGGGNGIFKSTDGGTTWKQLTAGLPESVLQANIAIAPSNPALLYAMVAPAMPNGASGPVSFYKSTDRGEHWQLAVNGPDGQPRRTPDPRPLGRIGGGDLPPVVVDPKNEQVVYSASTVMWRTEDGGLNWSAVRGSPGGDDYQRIWINPNDPNIIIAIADQGAVISANRGVSWSNWYTQNTAAMFHVNADNAFPYRLCAGQQDSGSACVDSRSMDGMITFRDWTPVNTQEYGVVAPDPRNPDIVFGSARQGVSRWDRRTRQTTQVGPDMSARGPNGEAFNRNVRTMPLVFSPVNADLLFYASNAVWRTTDRGINWKRISPDLTRQTWEVPASAGKYGRDVKPTPLGAITALAPSYKDANVLWAGTDDGQVQVTVDGGATWTNVTPAGLKPWTRIYNMEAGRHNRLTAYIAANTMRIDDFRPHFWKTHDGGKTWTEISSGLSGDYPANSIREDPRVKGLLYGATDGQVWVSYDDGAQWRSLRNNMPAISVRDIKVKDDSICQCADLVAGTHGRGFWILDNLTPIRKAAEIAKAASSHTAYLVRPATALRIRFGTNEPTPLPPEVPAGENPPPGAILDYFLPHAAGEVKLEIVDAKGIVVRTYSSKDPVLALHPALDRAAYDKLCQKTVTATFCGLPLYWPAEPEIFGASAGMHRVTWDMRLQPAPVEDVAAAGDVDATGAVPGRAMLPETSPWAPPGVYTVRLTVDGTSVTQPITLKLDPRVKTPAPALAQLATLSRAMWDGSNSARAAFASARSLTAVLANESGAEVNAFKAALDSIAPAPTRGGRGRGFGGRFGAPAGPATLASASGTLMSAAMAMQGAEVAPTARQVAACASATKQLDDVMKRWTALKTTRLAALNAARKTAGQAEIRLP
ncbi:MAG: glycoside hydrolase [Gemmatimonadetes bacterium]|nr:glycoside hydrolase [Gemmatimonadota bacterium]